MSKPESDQLITAGNLFLELYDKYSRLESKKFFYKEIEELTMIEINTVVVIGRESSFIKMSDIASQLGVSSGTPTVTIDRLIKKGYVERYRDEEDRRQVFVRLSPKGQTAFNGIRELKNKIVERLFGVLPEDQISLLIEILDQINSKFDDAFAEPLK